jgi:outer membrane protein OmpA-like peptidoglycan-associated protein
MSLKSLALLISFIVLNSIAAYAQGGSARAQNAPAQNAPDSVAREVPRMEIQSRGITISYLERKGATEVGFRYPNDPDNLPEPRGKVKVERKGGYCEIDVNKKFDLPGPASDLYAYFTGTENGRRLYPRFDLEGLGAERFRGKLAYVFWVVTTQGVCENLGEILFQDDLGIISDARAIDVTTRQPIFAMMVTAEPHAFVTHPSNAIVLINYGQQSTFTNSKGVPVSDRLFYVPRPDIIDYHKIDLPYPDNVNLKYRHRQARIAMAQARVAVAIAEYALEQARRGKEIDPRTPDTLIEQARGRAHFSVSEELQANQALEEARDHLAYAEKLYAPLVNGEKPSEGKDPLRPIVQESHNCAQLAQEAALFSDVAAGHILIKQKDALISLLVEEDAALKETIKNLQNENAQLRATIRQREARIAALEQEVAQLNAELEKRRAEIARLQARISQLESDNARLNGELTRICGELRKVIGTLGEIEQQGTTVTVRLKSDVLFPEAVYLLAVDRDLRKDVRPRLAQLAMLLQILFHDSQFQFVGHTDSVDTDDYNQWLSEQRALEVMHFFYLARLQVMSPDDPLRPDYEQKVAIAEQLLGNKFPEWKPRSQPGGLGDRKAEKLRQQRQDLLSQLAGVAQGRGKLEPRVTPETSEEDRQRNRRVEIKIALPPQASFDYCNQPQQTAP